jgi:hypothetical protein
LNKAEWEQFSQEFAKRTGKPMVPFGMEFLNKSTIEMSIKVNADFKIKTELYSYSNHLIEHTLGNLVYEPVQMEFFRFVSKRFVCR